MTKKNTIKVDTKNVAKKESSSVVEKVVKEEKTKAVAKKETVAAVKTEVNATVKKPAVKKVATKEAKKVEPVKATTKVETQVKEAKKVVSKKEPVKAAKKVVTKQEEVKVEPKKEVVKEPVKKPTAKKVVTKATTKKVATKKVSKKQDLSKYNDMALDVYIEKMQMMGVTYDYAKYTELLLAEADLKVIEKQIVEEFKLASQKLDFTKDGYDLDVVMATLVKVAETMDISAADFKTIKKDMDACVKTKLVVDADENSKNYLAELRVAEKVLMIGQRKNITTAKEVTALLKSDVQKFFEHFKAMAYTVLRNWKYEDVEFYQEFAFAFVSQYTDMFADYQNEIQMDCADLYILHGDEGRGDHEYNYVLRENEIKDYIYYRFANVYVERNIEKAKSIANSSFQFVDDRFDYFKKIVEIIEK